MIGPLVAGLVDRRAMRAALRRCAAALAILLFHIALRRAGERAGTVHLNHPALDTSAPFGGYKQFGDGQEHVDWGIRDFCEVKGIVGWEG